MKPIITDILIALVVILLMTGASQAQAFVNASQSEKLTAALNDACNDAWCEGPYEIKFESVRCSRVNHNCVVSMDLKDPEGAKAPTKNFSCLIEPLNTADDVFLEKPIAGTDATFIVPSPILLSSISKCVAAYQP